MRFNHFNEYADSIYPLIAGYALTAEIHKLKRQTKDKFIGKVLSTQPLYLKNGGIFSFIEEVRIEDGVTHHIEYSYKYEHTGYFFRYDMTERGYQQFTHEMCHLHANSEEPCYPTQQITLELVLGFIAGSFPTVT